MKIKNIWLGVGFLLTLAYFVTVGIFGETQGILAKFGKLELNTQGDTLAGFFAPLAFLWLFIATMIQSQELAAQRKEIEDNRAVMKEQSSAAQDQATFLKAQTDAMERQTQLLIEQVNIAQQTAERTHKMALFEKRIEIYNEVVAFAQLDLARHQFKDHHVVDLNVLATKAEFVFGEDVVQWLDELYQQVDYILTERVRWENLVGQDRFGNLNEKAEPELSQQIDHAIVRLSEMLWGGELKEVMGKYLDLNENRPVQMAVTEGPDKVTP
ncbi:hypothetical protein [Rhizobium bangladeshense]|uniref:hypothetical protein n=1 Tax=Rhizobium bangladeshense TaxID=1138189 RepID=UPI0007E5A4BC|nr:hypothetical protein [Rhizobium bangladeshense]